MKIGVVGIGKLGLATAEVLAKAGHEVIGVDTNVDTVMSVSSGLCPTDETDLQEYVVKYPIKATPLFSELKDTDASFIITQTPSLPDGSFDSKYVENAIYSLMDVLPKDRYHLFNVVSTVMPGTCQYLENIIAEFRSKETFGISYNPEFIAQGSILRDFQNPDFVLMGGNAKALSVLSKIYKTFIPEEKFKKMSLENAEVAKLALNCFVTMKINYGNLLAQICERIPEGNCDVIADAIGMDKRIGNRCLKGGAAYGGPCFPRDNRAFSNFLEQVAVFAPIVDDVHRMNEGLNYGLFERVRNMVVKGTVAVLGLPYKSNTSITTESAGVKLVERLRTCGLSVQVDNLDGADLAVVMLPQKELDLSGMRQKRVLDCWRTLEEDVKRQGGEYYAVGKS